MDGQLSEVLQPGLIGAAGVRYEERAPHPELSNLIERLYILETPSVGAPYPVVADGCADLIFDSRGVREPFTTLSLSRPFKFEIPPGTCLVGARLHPGGIARLLREPGAVQDGGVYPLGTLPLLSGVLPRTAKRDPEALLSELQDRLAPHSIRDEPAAIVAAAMRSLDRSPLALNEPAMADALGLSVRQLRRLFSRQIGLPPKRFQRVRRFQRSLQHLLTSPTVSLASLAFEHGYTDQAHLTHEWASLSGFTPARWRGRFLQDPP